jgi:TolB protein
MADLKARFGDLDAVSAPELSDILRRDFHPAPSSNRRVRGISIGVALVVAALGLGLAARAFLGDGSERPASAGTGQVLFSSALDGDMDLYSMNEDGSGLKQLTDLPWHETGEWSPDGTQIAFSRVAAANGDVYIMNADGTDLRALTDLESMDLSGGGYSWSPDGNQLLFTASPYGEPTNKCEPPDCRTLGTEEIFVINVDGTGMRMVTEGSLPQWSLDGSEIFFLRRGHRPGILDIALYSIRANGHGERRLTPQGVATSDMSSMSLSPDGSRLAFDEIEFPTTGCKSDDPFGCWRDYVSVASGDGSQVSRLAEGTDPVWSPDGTRIAFQREPSWSLDPQPSDGLYVMNADGTGVERIVTGRIAYKAWSPDGGRIVFSLSPADPGHSDYRPLYVINVDGTGLRRFVPGSTGEPQECCVDWRPSAPDNA